MPLFSSPFCRHNFGLIGLFLCGVFFHSLAARFSAAWASAAFDLEIIPGFLNIVSAGRVCVCVCAVGLPPTTDQFQLHVQPLYCFTACVCAAFPEPSMLVKIPGNIIGRTPEHSGLSTSERVLVGWRTRWWRQIFTVWAPPQLWRPGALPVCCPNICWRILMPSVMFSLHSFLSSLRCLNSPLFCCWLPACLPEMPVSSPLCDHLPPKQSASIVRRGPFLNMAPVGWPRTAVRSSLSSLWKWAWRQTKNDLRLLAQTVWPEFEHWVMRSGERVTVLLLQQQKWKEDRIKRLTRLSGCHVTNLECSFALLHS